MIHYMLWMMNPFDMTMTAIRVFPTHKQAKDRYNELVKERRWEGHQPLITQVRVGEPPERPARGTQSDRVKQGLALLLEDVPIPEIAHQLKVSTNTVISWKRKHLDKCELDQLRAEKLSWNYTKIDQSELERLRVENAKLRGILKSQGIEGVD